MKKPFDRITEAYFNQLGTSFGQKVRNRVHWVCENATGETILDDGQVSPCSKLPMPP